MSSESWFKVRIVLGALAIGFMLVATVYNSVRIASVYRLNSELVMLQNTVNTIRSEHEASIANATARIDAIEKVLFGDVVEKLAKAQPTASRVELWQQNRDKELRDRIQRLERWRAMWGEP